MELSSYKDVIEFLASLQIYLVIRNSKVHLVGKGAKNLTSKEKESIIETLSIKNFDDLERVKSDIRALIKKEHIPIKNWIEDERPREALLKNGAKSLSLSKLLAIILRTGNLNESAEELAKRILNRYGSLRALDETPIEELMKIEGVGLAKATQIKASLEIGKRLLQEEAKEVSKIRSPRDGAQYVVREFSPYLRDAKQEFFFLVLLDKKNKPIKSIEISKGSIDTSIVDPKDVVKYATVNSASGVILVHNHPSGETEPSDEDIILTKRLVEALNLVNIKVLDHIILGKNQEDYYSFASNGLL